MIHDPTKVTSFGCGCNKGRTPPAASNSRRVTIYEVLQNGSSVAEFASLPEARAKATEVGGRVKVTSKTVTV